MLVDIHISLTPQKYQRLKSSHICFPCLIVKTLGGKKLCQKENTHDDKKYEMICDFIHILRSLSTQ